MSLPQVFGLLDISSHFRYIKRPLLNASSWAWKSTSLPQICHWHLNEKATHSLSFSFHSQNSSCTCMFVISLFQRKTDQAHKDLKLSCLPQRDISVSLEFPSTCFSAGLQSSSIKESQTLNACSQNRHLGHFLRGTVQLVLHPHLRESLQQDAWIMERNAGGDPNIMLDLPTWQVQQKPLKFPIPMQWPVANLHDNTLCNCRKPLQYHSGTGSLETVYSHRYDDETCHYLVHCFFWNMDAIEKSYHSAL